MARAPTSLENAMGERIKERGAWPEIFHEFCKVKYYDDEEDYETR